MRIRGSKSAFIYGLLPALGGPIALGISFFKGTNIDISLILASIIFIILIIVGLGFIFIKEIEVNDEQIIIKKYLMLKKSIKVCDIKNIKISKGIVAIYTINDITFKFFSHHLNKTDFKEFNNYINNTYLTSTKC